MKNKILFILSFLFIGSFSSCSLFDTSQGRNYSSGSDTGSGLPKVSDPVFSPSAGTYTSSQNVAISTNTSGATIYYTDDGSDPTCSGANTPYTTQINVTSTQIIKAIGCKIDMADSDVISAVYNISTPMTTVATPVISPGTGTYTSAQTVTISTTTSGAVIYYTNDGSLPTCAGTDAAYTAQITISSSQTLQAIACEPGMNDSTVATAIYTITTPSNTVATPIITPPGGTYASTQTVTISTATSGATLRLTVDGSTPSCSGSPFTSPSQLVMSITGTTIKAIGCKASMTDSAMATATYTINSSFPCANGDWSYNGMGTNTSPCAACSSDIHSTGASTSTPSSTSCVCNSGYLWNATGYTGYCASCTSAKCPANTWSTTGYQNSSCSCTSCSPPATPNGSGASTNGSTLHTTGSTMCDCVSGYAWKTSAHACVACGGQSQICCDGSCTGSLVCNSGICNIPCFKKGTKVRTSKGEIQIEKIKAGDIVYSYDEKSKKLVESKVLKPLAHKDGKHPAVILTLENGIKLNVTTTHRFYSPKDGNYHPLTEFKVGDKVLLYKDSAQEVAIKSIVPQAPFPVSYNLELGDGPHNYLVEGIVVHNNK